MDALGDILVNPAHPKPPFRSEGGGFSKRQCTSHWKIRPFRRALRALMRERGLRIRKSNVNVWMGISFDEIERVAQPNVAYYRHVFPLVDRRLTREDCIQVIRDAGLPVPPKSACWFCPYTSAARTREIADKFPDVYGNLVMLQTVVGLARARRGLPRLIIGEGEESGACGGYCMT